MGTISGEGDETSDDDQKDSTVDNHVPRVYTNSSQCQTPSSDFGYAHPFWLSQVAHSPLYLDVLRA